MKDKKLQDDTEVLEYFNALVNAGETQEERDFFAQWIDVRRVKKGVVLLREGQVVTTSYYVYKGCIREFYNKDGEDTTVAFYTTGDTITDNGSHLSQTPSSVSWECTSECIISIFHGDVEQEMFRRFPRLESMCRMEIEKQYSSYKSTVNAYLSSSPLERYENLLKTKPEVFQLVPQYHIASYLGIKPESLSRIRKRLSLS